MLAADANPARATPADMQDTQDSFDEAIQRLSRSKKELETHACSCLLAKNRTIAKGGQGRLARFMGQQTLEADKKGDADGYVSDDDCIAVLFDETPGGPHGKKKEFRVYYGNVAKVTFSHRNKRVLGPRAHLLEESGEAVCKWFAEVTVNGEHVSYDGKKAYHLPIVNPYGFNEKVEFANILTAVRMTQDKTRHCYLLEQEDHVYSEQHRKRFADYENGTEAQRKRAGPWVKDVREGHDQQKTKVGQLNAHFVLFQFW